MAAILRHHGVKSRKLCIRYAAAIFKALDDLVLNATEEAYILREDGDVIRSGPARQKRGMTGQTVAVDGGVVFL